MKREIFPTAKAESLRKRLRLTERAFSEKLGFSNRSYNMALKRGVISLWMADRISRTFHISFEQLRDGK